jgi:hypothetical protein
LTRNRDISILLFMDANETKYAVELVGNGTWSLYEKLLRKDVRQAVLAVASSVSLIYRIGMVIRVRKGARDGQTLSSYIYTEKGWSKLFGTEIRDLEGTDAAACYMLRYPLPHVTREYAESQTLR